uniref:Uncharacterized protein n=1 Tax=Cacopsylla melanoneura TaxID=428564 RepID=A0A8D9DWS1_9HEMI
MESHNSSNYMIWTNSNSEYTNNGVPDSSSQLSGGPADGSLPSSSMVVKCEKSLNFATGATSEEDEYGFHDRRKMSRDPMSHRINFLSTFYPYELFNSYLLKVGVDLYTHYSASTKIM